MKGFFSKPNGSQLVAFVLSRISEPDKREEMPGPPAWVMIMEDGGVVTMGGSPFIAYYPNWEMMAFFTRAEISEYEADAPEGDAGVPIEWDTGSTMMGPMG